MACMKLPNIDPLDLTDEVFTKYVPCVKLNSVTTLIEYTRIVVAIGPATRSTNQ